MMRIKASGMIGTVALGIAIAASAPLAPANSGTSDTPAHAPPPMTAPAPSSPPGVLDAREAGARYGQALGVELICYTLRTTPALEHLPGRYTGADRAAFDAEAGKVLSAWREASTCRKAGGPNPCRLVYEWSCREAMREIGPEGHRLPGLIDIKSAASTER